MGRMGQKVIQAVWNRGDLALVGAVERPDHPLLGCQAIPLASVDLPLTSRLTAGDVYIDFTSAQASLIYLDQAQALGLGAVIGTTGFSAGQEARLRQAGEKIPVLWAPNMSIGVNVMYKIAAEMARMLGPGYDLEIVEAHHRLKKDAPSGTARKLCQALARARGLEESKARITGREGQVGERPPGEIGVLAVRGGDIIGDHTVHFCGPGERLELTHRATSRDTFAEGAARCAAWLAGRSPGFYSIDDTLGLA
jgi:4-hydroxy-tetrahydrodipicolinate reductase